MRALHCILFWLMASSFAHASLPHQAHVYDGCRLVSELDGLESNRVVAEYVPGPGYVDVNVAARRDLNRDGDFSDTGEGFLYYLTDQQHSTVALLDASGDVVERYGYDPFGAPSFFDGAGAALAASAYGNRRLYTGREWLSAPGLYDFRRRAYSPQGGRFLTTDPAHDPANLANPYTYVGNNPYAYVDPYGLWAWDNDWVQTGLEVIGFGAFSARGRAAMHSFWVESGGEQVRAMGAGAAVISEGGLGTAYGQIVDDTASRYAERIALHQAANGGNLDAAIDSATGWQMVGSDLAGFTALDEARTGLDYGSGLAISGLDRAQRGLAGVSSLAGIAAALGSATLALGGELGALGLPRIGVASPNSQLPSQVPSGRFYSVAFETRLSATSFPGVSRARHIQEANSSLLSAIGSDPTLALAAEKLGIAIERTSTGLAPRISPEGWTWHHAQAPGIMQLVPRSQHAPGSIFQEALHPGGRGGYSIWGGSQ